MKRFLKILAALVAVLAAVYFLGPKPAAPNYNNNLIQVPSDAASLEAYVASNEAKHKVKPDNEARIVWANDSTKAKTPYVIVYLHGFSASQEEGNPVHRNIAKQFGDKILETFRTKLCTSQDYRNMVSIPPMHL